MLLVKGLSGGLLFASQVLPAWCLTIGDFGTYSYLNSIIVVLTFFAGWGTDRYYLREVSLSSKQASEGDRVAGDANDNISAPYAMVVLNSALISIGLWFFLRYKLSGSFSGMLLLSAALILVARTAAQLASSISKGLNRIIFSELILNVLRPLFFVCILSLIYLFARPTNVEAIMLVFGVSFLLAFLAMFASSLRSSHLFFAIDLRKMPGLYKASFFFLLVGVGIPLMSNINTIQIGNMLPPEEVALFSAASKLVSLVLLALVSANLMISSRISPLFQEGKISEMQSLIRGNNKFVALLTILPTLLIVIFSETLLSLFGSQYSAAAPVLRILAIGQAFSVACGPVILTAMLTGLQKSTAAIVFMACVVNWSLCLLVIPVWGVQGAAWAGVLGNFLINGCLALAIQRTHGLNVTMLNLFR